MLYNVISRYSKIYMIFLQIIYAYYILFNSLLKIIFVYENQQSIVSNMQYASNLNQFNTRS